MVSHQFNQTLNESFRLFKNIYGNVAKKDLDFQEVIEESFGEVKLLDLLHLVDTEKVSVANAKVVM